MENIGSHTFVLDVCKNGHVFELVDVIVMMSTAILWGNLAKISSSKALTWLNLRYSDVGLHDSALGVS